MKKAGPASTFDRPWIRLRRRFFPRGLTFTREGKVYVGVTFGVGFAAVNTGNNLLFLVLGLMLGLIIVSGILSEMTLRKVAVRRRLPKRVEARASFPVEISLLNVKRFAGSFGVEVRDEIDGKPFRRRCFFLRVSPGEERSVAYRCELPKRGKALFNGTIISTRFPFGFFEKRRFVELLDEVIVLPARLPVSAPIPYAKEGDGIKSTTLLGPGQEFHEIKEMTPGDDPRRIHWRTTARLGRPMIRETEADARGFVEIVLDPAPLGTDEPALEQVERNIEAAGSIVRQMTNLGLIVRLITSSTEALESNGRSGAILLLEHLALLSPIDAKTAAPPIGRSAAAIVIGPRAKAPGLAYRLSVPKTRPDRIARGT